jgi:hypothetical protein
LRVHVSHQCTHRARRIALANYAEPHEPSSSYHDSRALVSSYPSDSRPFRMTTVSVAKHSLHSVTHPVGN